MLPLKSLCIRPGRAVWVIYADIMCINYDGNVTDASLFALVAALRNSKCVYWLAQPKQTQHTQHLIRSRMLSPLSQPGYPKQDGTKTSKRL